MSDKKTIAVIGATGAQGGGLVRAILADPERRFVVRAITRKTDSDKGDGVSWNAARECRRPTHRGVRPQNVREIIGVVGDVIMMSTAGRHPPSIPHRQFAGNRNWGLTQVVATDGPPERILSAVRAAVAAIDPELVVYRVAAMTDVLGRGSSRERFALVLMGAFAGVSLALAAIGLYGVLADTVRQRTPEIGIRMALGATGEPVRAMVFRQAAPVLVVGVVAGTAGALVLGRWLSSLAFRVSPWDFRILATTALLLTMTALVAAWLPARRAARIQPRIAKQEGH